jgi:hypothetical protein
MLKALVAIRTGLAESVTWVENPNVPAEFGIPEMTPVPALNDGLGGKLPEDIDQVYGGATPVTAPRS